MTPLEAAVVVLVLVLVAVGCLTSSLVVMTLCVVFATLLAVGLVIGGRR